ncbi:MAG TPA: UTP--glucose-1-phosphate uridylyltransferase GalU [Ktedonobacteraceae bacterium]|nr:UTP--glucose-1-phosphate uridylyltransferase GalU [Ktedonobacteraceae bacterium]
MRIRKAVLPVAGLGTRVLPASKVVPKPMLPIVDKPTVQYIVEEAVAAGIEQIIFVNSRYTRSIEDHFDAFPELEQTLENKGKQKELEELHRIQHMASYITVRQAEALGLGHAILCAKDVVGDEPFVVMLGDEIFAPETPPLPQLIDVYERHNGSVLCLFSVPRDQISSYGIASVKQLETDVFQVTGMVEKPDPEKAPSDLAIAGRYVMTPEIFEILEKTPAGRRGEIEITDALLAQAEAGHCFGVHYTGQRYDMGTPLGLLTTSITYALQQPEIAPALREYMRQALDQK